MTQDDQLHLATAHGFAKRKEWLEAFAALERMSPELRTAPEVLALKVQIFHGLQKWEMMEIVARTLANGLPDETQWFVAWVVSMRHIHGDEKAEAILADYIPALPMHGLTHYALGKFSWSMGDEKTAAVFFKMAFEIQPGLRSKALDDRDLDAYRGGESD